jgi:hypothetical protein
MHKVFYFALQNYVRNNVRGFVCTSARGGGKKKSETFPIGSAEFLIFLLAGFSACHWLE